MQGQAPVLFLSSGMTKEPANKRVTMVNSHLGAAPVCDLSPDFRVHWYLPGDEERWIAIHEVADEYLKITPGLFPDQFSDPGLSLAERQCYLLDANNNWVATGTAWAESRGRFAGFGRVHWVAVLPAFQRRGIGTALMSIVIQRLLSLGHTRAFLTTSTLRQPAIRLYEKFGFDIEAIEEPESGQR